VSFDFIAPHYRWLESIVFANALQSARTFFLDKIPTPKNVLIAGEGNGRFLQEFARRFPKVRLDCVDASAQMLRLARARLHNQDDQVRFLQNDLLTWSPEDNKYDLIVTHFFLDCFNETELEKIVATLAQSATQNAILLLADFSIPAGTLRKAHARGWLWTMHRFFRAVAGISARKLIDPSPFLEAHGFRCRRRAHWRAGLVDSAMWERPWCRDGRDTEVLPH
jgi:ubiquinone/menaquinone biosynthesis C-methylase UbiE